jgi:short-subunit dehydrogenase
VSQNNKARKVAVVTGCSKGIGKAIATESAKLGYCAVINSRNEDELKQTANDI